MMLLVILYCFIDVFEYIMIVFDLQSNTIYKSRKIFRHSNKEAGIIEPTALLREAFE